MDVAVLLEYRFSRTPDGKVWTQTAFPYTFWQRYLCAFDNVRIVARVEDIASVPMDWQRVDGDNVLFRGLPYYVGPWQYLLNQSQVRRKTKEAISPSDSVIIRAPSQIGTGIASILRREKRPYGLEIVGDPYDVFAPDAVQHPLRAFFRWWFVRRLRQQCKNASAVAYVTKHKLQERYPIGSKTKIVSSYSSIELLDEHYIYAPRFYNNRKPPFTLITVGSLAQMYKGTDVLIDAVAYCIENGLDARLVVIGDGKHKPELIARAEGLGLGDRVQFLGQLPSGALVIHQLDQADVFVLPSRTEGLPRAMLEAMARALPCIGSTAGGIPELLPPEDMVPPGNVTALAEKIMEVTKDQERLSAMSARNLIEARNYHSDILSQRRAEFYTRLRHETEEWVVSRT